jgi:hypothetical protein
LAQEVADFVLGRGSFVGRGIHALILGAGTGTHGNHRLRMETIEQKCCPPQNGLAR